MNNITRELLEACKDARRMTSGNYFKYGDTVDEHRIALLQNLRTLLDDVIKRAEDSV